MDSSLAANQLTAAPAASPQPQPEPAPPLPCGTVTEEIEDTRPDLPPVPEELWSPHENAFFDAGQALETATEETDATVVDQEPPPASLPWREPAAMVLSAAPLAVAAALWLLA